MSDNVFSINSEHPRKVIEPGELPVVEEIRIVAISQKQIEVVEMLGKRLSQIGAPSAGGVLLDIAAGWKVAV